MVCAGGRCVRASSANDSARPGHFYRAGATWPRAVHGAFVDGARRASKKNEWSPPARRLLLRRNPTAVRSVSSAGAARWRSRRPRSTSVRPRARLPNPRADPRSRSTERPDAGIRPVDPFSPHPARRRHPPPRRTTDPAPFPSRPRRARRASHRGGAPRRVRALRRPEGREHPARPPDAEEPGVRLRHLRGKVRAERPHSFPPPAPPNGHPSARSPVLPPIARAFDGPLDRSTPPSFETKPPATSPSLI